MTDNTGAGWECVAAVEPPRRKSGARKVFLWLTVAAAVAITVWALVLHFVAAVYLIPSEGMAPAVNPGDRVIVNKLYRSAQPKPGDVIVFRAPAEWSAEGTLIKRIVAVGGQTVECRAATGLTVDGQRVAEPYLDAKTMGADPADYPCLGNEFGPVTVPDGRLWVMGDNRTHSKDSRSYCTNVPSDAQRGLGCTGDPMAGTVPVDNVIGTATPAPWYDRMIGSATR